MEPKVIVVDYKDNPMGEMNKSEAHASPIFTGHFPSSCTKTAESCCRKGQKTNITAGDCGPIPAALIPVQAKKPWKPPGADFGRK